MPCRNDVVLPGTLAGLSGHGQTIINPAVNAIQSLVAVRRAGEWKVTLFHNTPSAFHRRPEAAAPQTEGLHRLLTKGA